MRKIVTGVIVLAIVSNVNAGFKSLTMHSRANCVNNESITWEFGVPYDLYTSSIHYFYDKWGLKEGHTRIADWNFTDRSAAVCWNEGHGGWKVWGFHWMRKNKIAVEIGRTYVVDCSIYDGWWD